MEIQKFEDNCIIVRIRPESEVIRGSMYEAARRCWRANLDEAKKAAYVLVVVGNDPQVQAVFRPECWYYPCDKFCEKEKAKCKAAYGVNTELCQKSKRIAFKGVEVTGNVKYAHKDIPAEYLPKQNPVRYIHK
jgi:hypothetical protein